MNLIKAINSGRMIRDPTSTEDAFCKWHKPTDRSYPPYMITRDTWEMDEPATRVTRSQFLDACDLIEKEAKFHIPKEIRTLFTHVLWLEEK